VSGSGSALEFGDIGIGSPDGLGEADAAEATAEAAAAEEMALARAAVVMTVLLRCGLGANSWGRLLQPVVAKAKQSPRHVFRHEPQNEPQNKHRAPQRGKPTEECNTWLLPQKFR
jgi:hypothetical protein